MCSKTFSSPSMTTNSMNSVPRYEAWQYWIIIKCLILCPQINMKHSHNSHTNRNKAQWDQWGQAHGIKVKDAVIDETDQYAACFLCHTAVQLRTLSFCHGSRWFSTQLLYTFCISSSFNTPDSDHQIFRKEFHELNWVCHIRETYNHRTTAL